jgi:hypothetical protein
LILGELAPAYSYPKMSRCGRSAYEGVKNASRFARRNGDRKSTVKRLGFLYPNTPHHMNVDAARDPFRAEGSNAGLMKA